MIACSVVDLPAPFGPIKPDDLALSKLELEAADGGHAAVADDEAVDREYRRRGGLRGTHPSSSTALSPR